VSSQLSGQIVRFASDAAKLGPVFGTRPATVAVVVLAACGLAACGGGPRVAAPSPRAVAHAKAVQAAKDLVISPAGRDADPSSGITVTAAHGKLTNVSVSTTGDPVTGTLSADGQSWHSTWALDVDTSYTVTATGTDPSGHPIETKSVIQTLNPSSSFATMIYEGSGATYGVGMPIMLTFSQPITNKAAVERSLELVTSKPVIGAWYWDGSEKVYFRPRDYWPADTSVQFIGHLNGVEGAPGMYGTHTLTQSFQIGQSVIAVASTATHQTQIYIGGRHAYTWPISTGRSTLPTPDGTYLTVEKSNPVRMIGGGSPGSAGYYNELVNWAVRFTFSGDYYHAAPWSVVDQGYTNVSHGCVNLSPADAQTYYNLAIPGDPITVTSSPKSGEWDDGWTEWFLSWDQYLAGSATREAVEAGPSGSTFVSAGSLPADTASAPLGTSAAGNWLG
jgi:lipoprotein-anchoring transpeptidase ErfK/SrfK